MNKLVRITISIIGSLLIYSLVLWSFDALSNLSESGSNVKEILENSLFWLSHFGLGPVLVIILTVIIYTQSNKILNKSNEH